MTTPKQPPTGQERYAGHLDGPDPLIAQFAQLFQGRLDAVGGDDGRAIYKPYTYQAVEAHLTGVDPIGVYPTWPDQDTGDRWTFWGCCDIDTGDWNEAFQLASALKGMGLVPHVERSRSKGWHIWVFVDQPVEAWQMRRCLKVAYAAIDLPAKEANPKSETLRYDQLGNYVRLPYKGGLVLGDAIERQCMMPFWNKNMDGVPVSFQLWITKFMEVSDRNKIIHWASKWYEPARRTQNLRLEPPDDVSRLVDRLDYGWRSAYRDPGSSHDRSQTIVALGYWCARRGWSPQDVYDLLWWSPWNKYADRNDGDGYIADIVERVFS